MTILGRDLDRILLRAAVAMLGVPAPEGPGFLRAVKTMFDLMPAKDRRLARIALHLLNVSPLFYFAGKNLTGLSIAAAEAHVARLAASRVPPFRRLARVAKTIVAYAYYGLPEAWPAIGYDGPWIGRIAVERLPDPILERPSASESR